MRPKPRTRAPAHLASIGISLDEEHDDIILAALEAGQVQRQVARALCGHLAPIGILVDVCLHGADRCLVGARKVQRQDAALQLGARIRVSFDHGGDHETHGLDACRESLCGITGNYLHAREMQRQVASLCFQLCTLGVCGKQAFDDGVLRLRIARPVQGQVALLVELRRVRLVLGSGVVLDHRAVILPLLDVENHVILLLEFLEYLLARLFLSGRHGARRPSRSLPAVCLAGLGPRSTTRGSDSASAKTRVRL